MHHMKKRKTGKELPALVISNSGQVAPSSEMEKRKVSFSNQEEVFTIPGNEKHPQDQCKLIVGKRYTKEEDAALKDAIKRALEIRGFGLEDAYKIFETKKDRKFVSFWNDVHADIPWRTRASVYIRGQVLTQRGRTGKWTAEEIEVLKKYHAEHGKDGQWADLSEHLDRHRHHIKDAWRRNRLPNEKKGHWSQEEYQKLFNLVNMDLRMKAFEEKKDSGNTLVRDNISWMAISDALATRTHTNCCLKWYRQLASPMIAQGLWLDCDDYRLIDALKKLDPSCVEDIDWDSLVENRSGDICRKRWNEMIRHIGEKKEKTLMEQVELLSTRYCPDMLQYRNGEVKIL